MGWVRAPMLGMAMLMAIAAARPDARAGDDASALARQQIDAILAMEADADFGAYLAGDCVTCHRPSGGQGIPPIAGLPVDHTVKALVEYRLKLRDNEVMTVRAARLADEEIAALAAHFAAQTP